MLHTASSSVTPVSPTKVLTPAQLFVKATLLALGMVIVMLFVTGMIYYLYKLFIST